MERRNSNSLVGLRQRLAKKRATWIVWYKRSHSGVTNLVWDPAANESFPTDNPKFVGYRERQRFRLPFALGVSTSRIAPTEHWKLDTAVPRYPLLQFWTLAVIYKIGKTDALKAECDILAQDGTFCGRLGLDCFDETTFFDSGGLFEFILVSKWGADDGSFNVMLLEWNGGVAERRGLGTIDPLAIKKSFPPGPVWKEILLA